MPRLPLALDIETVGQDWESLSQEVQAYLLDRAKSDAKREEVPTRLALHPGTGRVVPAVSSRVPSAVVTRSWWGSTKLPVPTITSM